jgi:hypothetical protein
MRNQGSRMSGTELITWPIKWDTFQGFLEDMGPRPKGTVLTRINSRLGYSKRNCEWGKRKTAHTGREWNHMITWEGATMNTFDWARRLRINKNTLVSRLRRGWSVDEAFFGRKRP